MDEDRFSAILKTLIALALVAAGCYLFHLKDPAVYAAAGGALGAVAGMVAPFAMRGGSKANGLLPLALSAGVAAFLLGGCGPVSRVGVGVSSNATLSDAGAVSGVGGSITLEIGCSNNVPGLHVPANVPGLRVNDTVNPFDGGAH